MRKFMKENVFVKSIFAAGFLTQRTYSTSLNTVKKRFPPHMIAQTSFPLVPARDCHPDLASRNCYSQTEQTAPKFGASAAFPFRAAKIESQTFVKAS